MSDDETRMTKRLGRCMGEVLVDGAELEARKGEIRALLGGSEWAGRAELDDAEYGSAFLFYLLFSDPGMLSRVGLAGLGEQRILYNRYYWFLMFSKLFVKRHGPDAGLEQQAFQLLEQASSGLDWREVEKITRLVERDSAV